MTISSALRVSFRARTGQASDGVSGSSGCEPRSARLLIVDDEPLLGRTLSLMFEGRYHVVLAPSGGEALELLARDSHFDMVLCDLDMPGVTGQAVYEWLARERPELAKRFVLMTGGAYSSWAEDFLLVYPGAQLEKPFSADDVERLLEPVPQSG